MGILELVTIALGLSMDACAVSVCKGLSVDRLSVRHMLITGLYFGGFQALMRSSAISSAPVLRNSSPASTTGSLSSCSRSSAQT